MSGSTGEGIKEKDIRPWGLWELLLEGDGYKVKRIVVNPGHRLSYQRHRFREERWIFVKGEGRVVLNGEEINVQRGSYVEIPKLSLHRAENTGSVPLVFIEVQMGTYLGEDDIERVEDDYGRAKVPSKG